MKSRFAFGTAPVYRLSAWDARHRSFFSHEDFFGFLFMFLLVLAVLLGGCQTLGLSSSPDPQQTVYAAKSTLVGAIQVATIYADLPRCGAGAPAVCSDPKIVATVNKAANAADAAIEAAESTVRNPAFSSSTVDAAVLAAQNGVAAFQQITQDLKVK